jgi:hypothetical protein
MNALHFLLYGDGLEILVGRRTRFPTPNATPGRGRSRVHHLSRGQVTTAGVHCTRLHPIYARSLTTHKSDPKPRGPMVVKGEKKDPGFL